MGARDLFTPDEWNQIVDAPIDAASLVIMASPSGVLGTAQELLAAYSQRKEQLAPRAASPLMQAIGETLAAREEQERQAAASGEKPEPPDAAELQAETMDGVRAALDLVTAKAGAAEAQVYREYLLAVASQVANAVKEGTWFGFGGKPVSTEEQAVLDALAAKLRIEPASSSGETN